MNKLTITIGIPAYNEEANIESLLKDLLVQKTPDFEVRKIIVASDGSADDTVTIARQINDKRLLIIDNETREGQGARQNQIIELTKSDILVLLNADIRIPDNEFLDKLVKPILNQGADLTSSRLVPTKPRNFFEKVLCVSEEYKNSVFELENGGNNLYTCHGAARAFTRKLYKQLNFSRSIAEDAYTYFYSISNGFRYVYAFNAHAYYTLPNTLNDHMKRSLRYFNSSLLLKKEFDNYIVDAAYKLPIMSCTLACMKTILKYPLHMVTYLIVIAIVKLKSISTYEISNISDIWEISKSTKGIEI